MIDPMSNDCPVSPYLRRGLTSRVGSGETGVRTMEEIPI